jgi:hypothetical protein
MSTGTLGQSAFAGIEPHLIRLMTSQSDRLHPALFSLFVDSDGQNGQSGTIAFQVTMAKWVKVADFSAAVRLNSLLIHYWRLPRPEVLISITGGAADFVLPPRLLHAFSQGLAVAALSAKAWIFTGGSDTGVMKLVGETVRRHDIRTPVIGVFPWGALNNRGILEDACGGTAIYKASPHTKEGAPLNPFHSNFLLVDNGTTGHDAWGAEIELRNSLEAYVSRSWHVPMVQLVVHGGFGTLATILTAAMDATPIVILADSGGAATAIYSYFQSGLEGVEQKFQAHEGTLKQVSGAEAPAWQWAFSQQHGCGRVVV